MVQVCRSRMKAGCSVYFWPVLTGGLVPACGVAPYRGVQGRVLLHANCQLAVVGLPSATMSPIHISSKVCCPSYRRTS